jgi:glycerophosphoryl diester phosphodiesterase
MKVIAHRGASGDFAENSLLAIEQAIKQCADGIELDAQYHRDSGKFILLHDPYVVSSNDEEHYFDDLPLSELLALTPNNQPITTLDKALELINGQCIVNIELKATSTNTIKIESIVNALQHLLTDAIRCKQFSYSQFVVSTFNHPLLVTLNQQIPQVDTAALIAHCPLSYSEFQQTLNVNSVNPSINCINKNLVDNSHQLDLAVWVYTVDKKQDILRCIQLGVDAIFTNYPARTKFIIEKASIQK